MILIIIDCLTKIIHYKLVKTTIDIASLTKIIIDIMVRHLSLLKSIISNRSSFFIPTLYFLPCYFFGIKQKLSTTFHSQTDGQTKKQIYTIKAYFQAFVNWEQSNWAKFLPMAELAYNNAKNVNTNYILFKLNCNYHFRVFFQDETKPQSKFSSADFGDLKYM